MNDAKNTNLTDVPVIIGNGNEVNIRRNPPGLGYRNVVEILIKIILPALPLALSFR